MITDRSRGFQLLDNNIEALRVAIESLLNKTKGLEWKKNFIKRKGKYYSQFKRQEEYIIVDQSELELLLLKNSKCSCSLNIR